MVEGTKTEREGEEMKEEEDKTKRERAMEFMGMWSLRKRYEGINCSG